MFKVSSTQIQDKLIAGEEALDKSKENLGEAPEKTADFLVVHNNTIGFR